MNGKHRGPGGRRGLNTLHIALIAAVAIIAVAAVGFIFFTGSSGDGQTISGPGTTPAQGSADTTQQRPQADKTLDPASIVVPTTVSVPGTGIFIRVQYMGAYTGSYTADGDVHPIENSGDRLFMVEDAGQTVTVTAKKADRSTKQTLSVEIWKDGKLIKSAGTAALFGQVDVTAAV